MIRVQLRRGVHGISDSEEINKRYIYDVQTRHRFGTDVGGCVDARVSVACQPLRRRAGWKNRIFFNRFPSVRTIPVHPTVSNLRSARKTPIDQHMVTKYCRQVDIDSAKLTNAVFPLHETLSISLGPPLGPTDQQTGSSRTRTGTGERDSRSSD